MSKDSWLTTHPHIRRLVYGAAVLACVGTFVVFFGPDETLALIKGLLGKAELLETTTGVNQ